MNLKHGALFLSLVLSPAFALAMVEDVQESTSTAETPAETERTPLSDESEAKDIIPRASLEAGGSTQTLPTSPYSEKKPYDQAREELLRAYELSNSGHAEAASDLALQAYDDFLELRRVPGVKRSTIRSQIHQAAKLYVEAGISYIQNFVRRLGSTPEAIEEGRARMEDLRDVARNYPELNKMLNSAINDLSSPPVKKPTNK